MPLVGFGVSVDSDTSLLASNFAKVDLPDDLGPQIMIARGVEPFGVEHLANISFHSGGDINGCR
jgi:hypothetical protein